MPLSLRDGGADWRESGQTPRRQRAYTIPGPMLLYSWGIAISFPNRFRANRVILLLL